MKKVLAVIFGILIFFGVIYSMYWVVKTISYTIFYQDMVEETVREMVKPEYLI